MDNRYNLLDEKWIPMKGAGLASIKDCFLIDEPCEIGGNPLQHMAVLRLLLAIAQRACPVKDNSEWRKAGVDGLKEKSIEYLDFHHDDFWLYGNKPFLQDPSIITASDRAKTMLADGIPQLPSNNAGLMRPDIVLGENDDSKKAIMCLTLQCYALQNYSNSESKHYAPASSPAFGFKGYLNSHLAGRSIAETIWLNLLTEEQITEAYGEVVPGDIMPPWEEMPEAKSEDRYISSIWDWYIPCSRRILLFNEGIILLSGLHCRKEEKKDWRDPFITIAVSKDGKKTVLNADPSKAPWRTLPAMLSSAYGEDGTVCWLIKYGLERARNSFDSFSFWVGGLSASLNTGNVMIGVNDGFVESYVEFSSESFDAHAYQRFKASIEFLEKNIATALEKSVNRYFTQMGFKKTDGFKKTALVRYWTIAEGYYQELLEKCEKEDSLKNLFDTLIRKAISVYESVCPSDTASQLFCMVKNRPLIRNKYDE